MYRKSLIRSLQLTAVAAALGASAAAVADDGSLSRLTGDSYAYFSGLEYRGGQFNVETPKTRASARAQTDAPMAVRDIARKDAPADSGDAAKKDGPSATVDPSNATAPASESKILLAGPRIVITPPAAFRDNTA